MSGRRSSTVTATEFAAAIDNWLAARGEVVDRAHGATLIDLNGQALVSVTPSARINTRTAGDGITITVGRHPQGRGYRDEPGGVEQGEALVRQAVLAAGLQLFNIHAREMYMHRQDLDMREAAGQLGMGRAHHFTPETLRWSRTPVPWPSSKPGAVTFAQFHTAVVHGLQTTGFHILTGLRGRGDRRIDIGGYVVAWVTEESHRLSVGLAVHPDNWERDDPTLRPERLAWAFGLLNKAIVNAAERLFPIHHRAGELALPTWRF